MGPIEPSPLPPSRLTTPACRQPQAGRILTRDDKAWVKTRLDLLVMQLHPPSLVRPGLYLGTWYNACDLPQLRARGVTHVLNMCGEEHFAPPSTEYAAAGIRCHRCPVTDQPDADISPHLRESMHFLQGCDRASGPAARCLTRCVRSLSRSRSFTTQTSSTAMSSLEILSGFMAPGKLLILMLLRR